MSSSDSEGPSSNVEQPRTRSSSSSSARSHASNADILMDNQLDQVNAPRADVGSDSERSHASPTPEVGKRRLVDSSSDEEMGKKVVKSSSQGDVFGDDLSSDSDNAEGDVGKRHSVEDEEETNDQTRDDRLNSPMEEETVKTKIVKGECVRVKLLYDNDLYHVRMPNFLSIETKPFVPEHYEDIYDENDVMDEEGRNRLKLKVENTLRWRQTGTEADPSYESNAKIVKWSDGTMSLMVGNEIFECQNTRLHAPMHLFIRQTHGLTGCGIFTNRIKFRPSTTESKTHKKVTMTVADRTKKSGQVRFIEEVGVNPDDAKKDLIRREEEALRAAYRRERDQTTKRRDRERYDRHRMSSGFLEGRGDFSEDESPKRGKARRDAPLIGASSDESDDEAKRIEKSKEDASDSDEEYRRKKQEHKKKIVSSDEEDSD